MGAQVDLLSDGIETDGNGVPVLPERDNEKGAVDQLLAFNRFYRSRPWPAPFDRTSQHVVQGDARRIPVADEAAGLVLTHPPYFDLKAYEGQGGDAQLGHWSDYRAFLAALDDVWRECWRVLEPGGRVCCVIGDVLQKRRDSGRHSLLPIPHDIMSRSLDLGFEPLTPILWGKVANKATETASKGGGYLGKPYQPNGIIDSRLEYVVMLRKPGYRRTSMTACGLSMLTPDEVARWQQAIWYDIPGTDLSGQHPAPFPARVAHRLIRLYSFAGDLVVDPFAGSGTSLLEAARTGRNALGVEVEPRYADLIRRRLGGDGELFPVVA